MWRNEWTTDAATLTLGPLGEGGQHTPIRFFICCFRRIGSMNIICLNCWYISYGYYCKNKFPSPYDGVWKNMKLWSWGDANPCWNAGGGNHINWILHVGIIAFWKGVDRDLHIHTNFFLINIVDMAEGDAFFTTSFHKVNLIYCWYGNHIGQILLGTMVVLTI